MKISVNHCRRSALCRAHTATHLLHQWLHDILWQTKQEWSRVGEDSIRFDFSSDRFLTAAEIVSIEQTIATIIRSDFAVSCEEMGYDAAIALWAQAFFTDKYGDRVRVVRIDWTQSIELCGGTHVNKTWDIGSFFIIGQESVSAGVKRIVAVCGPETSVVARDISDQLDSLCSRLWLSAAKQLDEKMDKLLSDYTTQEQQIISLRQSMTNTILTSIKRTESKGVKSFLLDETSNPRAWRESKDIVASLKNHHHDHAFIIYDTTGFFVIWWTDNQSAKDIRQSLGLKWWWSDTLIQWKDQTIQQKLA